MGLSSKQVSSDGFDWSTTLEIQKSPPPMMAIKRRHHQQQQYLQNQPVQLKCPRCDSSNTKFCYYNNYNNSQPRHFCRTCKRHWTEGGTLRNVPVGGGRKNKRIKKSLSAAAATSYNSNSMRRRVINSQITVQTQNQRQNFPPVSLGHQKNLSELLRHDLLCPPTSSPVHTLFHSGSLDGINYSTDQRGLFLGLNSLPSFTLPDSNSFETKPFQISKSFQSSEIDNYSQDQVKTIDQDPTSTITHSTNSPTNASSILHEMTNVWNWEDVDTFAATGFNFCWDDSGFANPQKL